MKHTNFNMPSLRRITLFAILLLGTMPMWGAGIVYVRVENPKCTKIRFVYNGSTTWYHDEMCTTKGCDLSTLWYKIEYDDNFSSSGSAKFSIEPQNGTDWWGSEKILWKQGQDESLNLVKDGTTSYVNYGAGDVVTASSEAIFNSECGIGPTCTNCEYLGEE